MKKGCIRVKGKVLLVLPIVSLLGAQAGQTKQSEQYKIVCPDGKDLSHEGPSSIKTWVYTAQINGKEFISQVTSLSPKAVATSTPPIVKKESNKLVCAYLVNDNLLRLYSRDPLGPNCVLDTSRSFICTKECLSGDPT